MQKMTQPNRPTDFAAPTIGAVVGHGHPHFFQPLGGHRGSVVAIDAVDTAQGRLRAKVVNVWNCRCPGSPVTIKEPTRSHACASNPTVSPRRAPKLIVPSTLRRRNMPIAARACTRQRPSQGTRRASVATAQPTSRAISFFLTSTAYGLSAPGVPIQAAIRRKGKQAMAALAKARATRASHKSLLLQRGKRAKRSRSFDTYETFPFHLIQKPPHVRNTGLRRHMVTLE